jgi:hypothetical protein
VLQQLPLHHAVLQSPTHPAQSSRSSMPTYYWATLPKPPPVSEELQELFECCDITASGFIFIILATPANRRIGCEVAVKSVTFFQNDTWAALCSSAICDTPRSPPSPTQYFHCYWADYRNLEHFIHHQHPHHRPLGFQTISLSRQRNRISNSSVLTPRVWSTQSWQFPQRHRPFSSWSLS